jgi:peptide/nickel transport system ATP-binding protein
VVELLKELQLAHGFAILFITHDMRIASSIADDVVSISDGRISENTTVKDLAPHTLPRSRTNFIP